MYLVCGEALFDLFADTSGDPAQPKLIAQAGGSPMNVAIGLARLGQSVDFLSHLSTDPLGQNLRNLLRRENIDVHLVQDCPEKTTLSFVALDQKGVPEYGFYVPDPSIGLDFNSVPDLGDNIAALHIGSYSAILGKTADSLFELVRRERRRFISLDVNVRPTVEADMDLWKRRITALLPFVNLVKASDEDLELLFGEADPSSIAAEWLDQGVEMVIVTCGSGSVKTWRKDIEISVTPPKVTVVDTVGAGDSFQAAFLMQLAGRLDSPNVVTGLSPLELETMLHFACAAAAVTCTRKGADLPSQNEIASKLQQ